MKKNTENYDKSVRLVGIGASAGGLEALCGLMESLPKSNCLSYVIAQHVSPTHTSMMVSLLASLTHLVVKELKDTQTPQPGHVYITPPNHDVLLENGLLRLTKPENTIGPKPSANRFFFSLAHELKEHAIGIILSGTGSDGALGMNAIKEAGGITIAQKPETAKYAGMPMTALHTGDVDLFLSPSEIGSLMMRLLNHPNNYSELITKQHKVVEYDQIYHLVRNNTGFKLDAYKHGTVKRRIARRMSLLGIQSLADYVKYHETFKEESQFLVNDTFISVTFFFRDNAAFKVLGQCIDEIVRKQPNRDIIRCWVPGCASGEEVYSIAILLEESLKKQQCPDLQYIIFASDLDEAALERARLAIYPIREFDKVPIELLEKYTELACDHRRIQKNIRNRIVFTRQNVIVDPAFGNMNLISCRNLLIYLTPDTQEKVLEVLHYALKHEGYLFIGKSENLDLHKNLFEPVNKKANIYQPRPNVTHYSLPVSQKIPAKQQAPIKSPLNLSINADDISLRAHEELSRNYAPPSIVIDENNNIVHFEGNLKPYLNFPKGRAELLLFDMITVTLRNELRALVYRCRHKIAPIQTTTRSIEVEGKKAQVAIAVHPIEYGKEPLLLISFLTESSNQNYKSNVIYEEISQRESVIISELERELSNTRRHLSVIVEKLKIANEELRSANEELQSTNEELHTSNEELQSINEELLTVNDELQVKSTELEKTSTVLVNVKQSIKFPLIVVDKKLCITQTNAACKEIAVFDSTLENHSLNSVQWLIELPGLNNHVKKVISKNIHYETKIINSEISAVFQLYIMPYQNKHGQIDGAILIFNNISAQHSAEIAFLESEMKFHQAMLHAPIGIALQSLEGQYLEVNPALCDILGYTEEELLTLDFQSVTYPDDLEPTMTYFYQLLSNDIENHFMDKRFVHKDGHIIWTTLHKALVKDNFGKPKYFIVLVQDISERKIAEEELRLAASVFSSALDGIIITDDRARIIKANLAYEKILGYSSHEVIGKHARYLRSCKHNNAFYHMLWQQVYEKGSWQGEIWIRHKKGHVVPIWLSISTQQNASGKANYYIGVMYDISEQKHYNERINFLAHYDALTLLPNRTLFTDRLQQSITYAKRNKFKFALLFIDLDDFKHVNDSRGHLIGDELLRKVATKLSSIMRATDTVFRLGGDEFTILTETENDINEDKVSYIATKVLDTISKPIDLSGEKVHISASIGITLYPDDGDDIESLLKHADMAMYRSKESGRNNFLFYTQEMSKRVQERILLHTDLRKALQDHRLQFYYQPIIDIQTKSYVGAEALLRWKHADLGWVSPQKFISIAEDSDLILELGEWALLQACQQLKLWLNAGIDPGVLSVNVSGKQLIRGDFLKITKDILEKTNCPPEKIILEMTESFIMKESEGAITTLYKLRELGLGVAIDDFGTGYSSLSYLKRLPITNLKLDQSFVQDLPGDTNVVEITRAIFSMGSALGLNIVFEGVETRQQHDFLLAEKCKFAQGFHYAKPMSSEIFSKYLKDAEYFLDLTD